MFFSFAKNKGMKKSTKILLIIYIIILVPALIFGKYIFQAIEATGNTFNFNFNLYSIIGLVLNLIAMIFGTILFFLFINSLSFDKAIFFSSLPLIIVYGAVMFMLAQLSTYQNQTAKTVSNLLNITADNQYNTVLWAILITLVFVIALFFNYLFLCKPVGKVEKIVNRLSDGRVREEKLRVGGVKQFHNIEYGLNKINNNYREKDKSLKAIKLEAKKFVPKQFFKFLGKNNISELELGNQVKKNATTMLVKLVGVSKGDNMSLEESFNFVNSYVHVVSPLVRKFNGFIDKYLGEGLLAVFGSPQDALDCSHAMSRAINIKNRQNKTLPNVDLRVSIINGEVVFGVIGEEEHKIPTIVSDIVVSLEKFDNIASLISARVVFSKHVLDSLPLGYKFAYRHVGEVSLHENVESLVFEDIEVYPRDKSSLMIKTKHAFEKGVMFYSNGEYEKACSFFEEVLQTNSADKCAYIYFNKSKDKIS